MTADPFGAVAALPAVAKAAAAARDAVDGVLRNNVLRRRSAEVTAESALRGARASAALDGAQIDLERLRGLLLAGSRSGDPIVDGAVRLNAELGALRETWARSPRQALAQLHVLAASGRAEADAEHLGQPRSTKLVGSPDPLEVAARLDGLLALLLAPTAAPAIVVAAIVHGELLALKPFGIADAMVARAAERLTLVTRGLDPKAVTAPEVGHVELEEGYREAAARYVAGDVAGWVEHCCAAIALGAREGLAVCAALER